MSQQLIINADSFGGIYPHKGAKSVRVNDPFSGTRWIPVQGREVVVARQRHCSEGYVPVECLPQEFVATLKEWQVWHGLSSGTPYVWMRDLPVDGIRLTADWRTYASVDGGRNRFTVPAGTLVIPGEPGNLYESGHHWEVAA